MRTVKEYRTASKANYNRFMGENPSISITYKQYCKILTVCNRMFMTKALDTGEPVKMPFGFGKLVPSKYKTRLYKIGNDGKKHVALPVDWQKSRQEGYKVYNMNFHSDGYGFKWRWMVSYARLHQSDLWVMKPTRWASRELAKYVFKDKYYSQLYKHY